MLVSLIVAMDENRGIGFLGQLPWKLPADLQRFRTLTMGHHIIMGRKTYQSIGRPLPNRKMVVVTRQADFEAPGCQVISSLDKALELACRSAENEAFIIGGAEIYTQSLPWVDRLYLTRVHARLEADVYFPPLITQQWQVIDSSHHPIDERHLVAFTFETLERVKS